MLSLRTKDDWTAAQITLDDGGGAQTYTLLATDNSAFDAMTSLVAWADTNVPGAAPFGWSWTREATDDGATVTLTSTGNTTLVANASAQTLLGFSASYSSSQTHEGANSAQGTWAPAAKVGVRNYYRVEDGDNAAGGTGACRGGVPGLAAFKALINCVCDLDEIARLTDELADAQHDRLAWVYQAHKTTWRRVAVGDLNHGRIGGTLHRVELAARGVA